MADGPRPMAEADIDAAAAIQVDAFGGVLADVLERYQQGARYTWRDAWVYEIGGEIGAVALLLPAAWWFRGQRYEVSAVAGVAVRPVDRRKGLASKLMRAILEADRAAGRAYSLLYPFQHGFYRRQGYGSVGLMHFYRLPLAQMPDEPALRRRVRVLREADRASVEGLFERALRERPEGGLERRPAHWQVLLRRDEKWVVYEDAGVVGGYLVYRAQSNALDVRELVALDASAERGLWSFVAAQIEQRAAATLHAPAGSALWTMLREPYMFEGPEHGFIVNDVAGLTMSFMARGVDWRAALEARTFPEHAHGRFSVRLEDPLFGSDTLSVEVQGGRASVTSATTEADARCHVSVFSQLCGGAVTATQARWFGQLEASDSTIKLLDAAFPFGPPFIAPFDWF